jgi:probable H4MPT-linked C1 transfer pathway protein
MTSNPVTHYFGWDIGGAHVKLAIADVDGHLTTVMQWPCELWKGIEKLDELLKEQLPHFPAKTAQHAITMTGELVDAFPNRQIGVSAILNSVKRHLPADRCAVLAHASKWLSLDAAKQNWLAVASMNWQASARLAAQHYDAGLLIDCGSTTTDIIPFHQQHLMPCGETDHARLSQGSLVYTGAIRTPLMAIADHIEFREQSVRTTAEWFATSADIWLLLSALEVEKIQDPSADGQPWTLSACRQRLARMIALDADDVSNDEWVAVAQTFADKQMNQIVAGIKQVITQAALPPESPIVGAGVGRFIVQRCATLLGRPYINFADLCESNSTAADHAPAAALALLAHQQLA